MEIGTPRFKDNAKAALITRGLAEMARFCRLMSVSAETLYGLAGIGDLIATCGSQHSRNRHVVELLGQSEADNFSDDQRTLLLQFELVARPADR